MSARKILIVICGPTAVGKTAVTLQLAHHFKSEILSADSRQFYRELVIGSAMPTHEEQASVPHHFIGQLSIHDAYNISVYENEALQRLEELYLHHDLLFLTGGSGLYIDAVCRGIDVLPDTDPEVRTTLKQTLQTDGIEALQHQLRRLDPTYYAQVDLKNPGRLIRALEVCLTTGRSYSSQRMQQYAPRPFQQIRIGLELPKEILIERIRTRTQAMLSAGLENEARELYPFRHLNALNTVGYKELFSYFDGDCSREEASEKIITNTWRYAKRQMTWFRRDSSILWHSPDQLAAMTDLIDHASEA